MTHTVAADVEERWLDHAWRVVSCPDRHRQLCEAAGGATLRVGAVDGNELRWPGYLGRNYLGILCVGHVHRESTPDGLACQPLRVRRSYAQLEAASRAWLAAGRSPENDAAYLEAVRRTYEEVLSRWSRWRDFGKVVEQGLGLDVTHVAWANLAKCRLSIDRNPAAVTELCQRQFPIQQTVQAIRPVVVLSCVLNARPGGGLIRSWRTASADPWVWTWHGRRGTDPSGRPISEWAPEVAERILDLLTADRPGQARHAA